MLPYNSNFDGSAFRDHFHYGTGYGFGDPRPAAKNWPVDGYSGNPTLRSSPFGDRRLKGKPDFHPGMDFAVPIGTPVKATMDGTIVEVKKSQSKDGLGNVIVIKHGDRYYSTYGHLSQMDAKIGDTIKAGTVIGRSGNTGKSTNPHLHYEVSEDGYFKESRRFDPEEWHRRKDKE